MLDKEGFFEKYKVKKEFDNSGLSWNTLEEIYDDYLKRAADIEACTSDLERYILKYIEIPIHSIRCRKKDAEHLIEKIIRKCGKEQVQKYKGINVSNYCEIVRDLIGIRILILAKEEWENIFDRMVYMFPECKGQSISMAEPPVAYTRYGDRNIFKDKIRTEHTNKGYRSQHYVVEFKGYYCEIQVRTLSEEVYGEFDHKVKYPYRDDNKFLIRYTNTLSQLLDSVDEIISTCFQLGDSGWEECNRYYEKDHYIDWKNISQKASTKSKENKGYECKDGKIEVSSYVNGTILRKG